MTTTLTYPSAQFPGPPSVSVEERTDGRMDTPFALEIDAVPFVGVNVSWRDERVGDVVQAHLFAGSRRGQVVDLIQVTGSVGGEQVGSEYSSVQTLMRTVRVTR